MIELTFFAVTVLILGILLIPRTTFLITGFFNTAAVSAVLGGPALVLAIIGFLVVPRVMLTYFLLEAVSGAPTSGSTLYLMYIAVAGFIELSVALNNLIKNITNIENITNQ